LIDLVAAKPNPIVVVVLREGAPRIPTGRTTFRPRGRRSLSAEWKIGSFSQSKAVTNGNRALIDDQDHGAVTLTLPPMTVRLMMNSNTTSRGKPRLDASSHRGLFCVGAVGSEMRAFLCAHAATLPRMTPASERPEPITPFALFRPSSRCQTAASSGLLRGFFESANRTAIVADRFDRPRCFFFSAAA